MRINTSKLSFFTLCVLLPLLHLHSYFAGAGVLSTLKGKTLFILLLTVPMGIIFLRKKFSNFTLKGIFLFSVILFISLTIVLSDFGIYDCSGNSALRYNISIIFFYCVYFIMGFFLEGLERRTNWIIFLWLLMISNLIFHYDFHLMSISMNAFDEDAIGMYLFLGDSFALWSLLLLSLLQKRPFISMCVFMISATALYSFMSRASLYAFIIMTPLIIYFTKKSLKYYFLIFVLVFSILFSEIITVITETNSRMFAFQNLNEDPSVILRTSLNKKGLSGIKHNWFIGDYSGQIRYGILGSYIHNYLSLWRQFGLIPFISFCLLIYFFILKSWKITVAYRKNRLHLPDTFFLVVGGAFCLIEIIAARSYTSPYIWLFIGMTLRKKM